MRYDCRSVLPIPTERWHTVDAATPEQAVQVYHELTFTSRLDAVFFDASHGESVYFRRVEVRGIDGTLVSRLYHRGIRRRGGVRPPAWNRSHEERLRDVATAIGWTKPVADLLTHWEGESEQWG